jgi:Ala-tRNA(Pro) deacylase
MLDVRGIRYEETHHPEAYTAQQVAQEEHVSGHRLAKVVVVLADGRPVVLVLPASRHVVLERLREVLPARSVRLASEEEMAYLFTDCEVGALPPLRRWQNVSLLMDAALYVAGDIVFQAGTHTDAIRLPFKDWYRMVNPRIESFSTSAVPVHA